MTKRDIVILKLGTNGRSQSQCGSLCDQYESDLLEAQYFL